MYLEISLLCWIFSQISLTEAIEYLYNQYESLFIITLQLNLNEISILKPSELPI